MRKGEEKRLKTNNDTNDKKDREKIDIKDMEPNKNIGLIESPLPLQT